MHPLGGCSDCDGSADEGNEKENVWFEIIWGNWGMSFL